MFSSGFLRFHLRNGQSRRSVKSVGCSDSGFQPVRLKRSHRRSLMNPGRVTFPSIQKLHPSHSTRRLGAVFFLLWALDRVFSDVLLWMVCWKFSDAATVSKQNSAYIHIYSHCLCLAALCFSLQLYKLYTVQDCTCNAYSLQSTCT